VLFIYLKNHIKKVKFSAVTAKVIFQTYANSLSIGSIGLLANFFDYLPIICAGSLLKPVEAATTQLVLRITSVSLIPTNALANVSLAEKAKSKNSRYIKNHLLFSIFSSLAIVFGIFLVLNYMLFFENYPGLTNFLWFQIISVIVRSFLVTIGNYLTFKNRNRLRVSALGAACSFFLSIFFLINFELIPGSASSLLLSYLLSEIVAFLLICFQAKKVKG
jgi:O-antigen/teichoic acid export membrane protein